jgi:hypothetical protein
MGKQRKKQGMKKQIVRAVRIVCPCLVLIVAETVE